jgi:hypothetical protein
MRQWKQLGCALNGSPAIAFASSVSGGAGSSTEMTRCRRERNCVMHLADKVGLTTGDLRNQPVAGYSPTAGGYMESRKLCAYNQTRECFRGLEVTAADISYANLKDLISTLALKSGEGLWIVPFRGILATGTLVPLDLVYLDEESKVIEVVESFPTFRATPSSPRAASVLALPTHSIYSSQTQPGDQLVLCAVEEMERRLERFSSSTTAAGAVQSAVLLREVPLWSGGPGLLQLEDRSTVAPTGAPQILEMDLVEPGTRNIKAPKNWLERWWSPDPRKAPREPSPGVAAYYWTGAAPEPHSIKDISSTGLYIVTEERWYPGTLVLMTLTKSDSGDKSAEHSISVHSRAVRWGDDGVGLQFVLAKSKRARRGDANAVEGVDQREIEEFLLRLRKGNG